MHPVKADEFLLFKDHRILCPLCSQKRQRKSLLKHLKKFRGLTYEQVKPYVEQVKQGQTW